MSEVKGGKGTNVSKIKVAFTCRAARSVIAPLKNCVDPRISRELSSLSPFQGSV